MAFSISHPSVYIGDVTNHATSRTMRDLNISADIVQALASSTDMLNTSITMRDLNISADIVQALASSTEMLNTFSSISAHETGTGPAQMSPSVSQDEKNSTQRTTLCVRESSKLDLPEKANIPVLLRHPSASRGFVESAKNIPGLLRLSNLSGDSFGLGYCYPKFHCPLSVPLAYQEVPKNGCSAWKRYLHEIDGLNWNKEHGTKHVCCRHGTNRVKFLITRNPYTRFVSMFVNKVLGGRAQSMGESDILRSFGKFVESMVKAKRSNFGKNHHFHPQYFFDKWIQNRTKEFEGKELTNGCRGLHLVLKLEEFDKTGISFLEKRLCSELGYCAALPPRVPLGNAMKSGNRSPTHGGFLTAQNLLKQNPTWANVIAELYETDFSLYNYSNKVDQIGH